MCSDSRPHMGSSLMSGIPLVTLDGRDQGEDLHQDRDPTKGGNMDQQQPDESSRTLFFARCPPTLPHQELLQLFGKFGHITSFNLYRRWAKAKNSKGCGTVVFADKASAAAALAALDGRQQWPESETPMVVEWAQASKIRHQGLSNDAATGNKPVIDAQTLTTVVQAAERRRSSSSGSMHMESQQLFKQPLLHMPMPHCNANTSCSSSSGAPSAIQRLGHEALTVHTAHMDCCSHAACSPLSEQDVQGSVPSHVLPMMGCTMRDPAVDSCAPGSQHNSTPAHFMRQLPAWGDSSASLPHVTPPLAVLHGSYSSNGHQGMPGEQGYCSSSYALASLSNSPNIWASNASMAAAAMASNMHMRNNGMLQPGSVAAAAAGAAAMHSMSGPLLQVSPRAAAAPAHQYTIPCLWSNKEREASLYHTAEGDFNNSACCGSSATAAAAAACQCSSVMPQLSSCGILPSLLEGSPAMSWLQLQQLEHQHAYSAAAGAAAAAVSGAVTMGGPNSSVSGSCAGYNSVSSHAGVEMRAAQAAASLREVTLDLNPEAAKVLVGELTLVKNMSGADVNVTSSMVGLQLRLRGSSGQIETACGALRMLLL